MPQSTKRDDFKKLAEAKLGNALLLLENERFGDAYYLAGYAIELGLKAVIAKQMVAQAIPDLSFIKAVYTHDIGSLVKLAGLAQLLQEEQKASEDFRTFWALAGGWSESSRYFATEAYSAQLMVHAVAHPDAGILRWIRQYW